MNIFALDSNPKLAAQYHVDKHVVKMILESCQLLSTAHRVLDGVMVVEKSKTNRNVKRYRLLNPQVDSFLYSATHINHPSAVWCRSHYQQYKWLAELTKELCIEYTYRYGKVHKCEQMGLVDWFLQNSPKNIHAHFNWHLPTPAMPDDCKVPGDVVQSYRNYYNNHKQRMHSWSGKVNSRAIPSWISDMSLKNV
jgi:hypothetical protein